jgi:hypothetical protein
LRFGQAYPNRRPLPNRSQKSQDTTPAKGVEGI